MAVLAVFTGKGITKKMYEALRSEVKWEKKHPKGVLVHSSSFDEKGDLRVVDVWESPEAMDAFFESRLMPAMQKLKIPAPAAEVHLLHNLNLYPAADGYKLAKSK